MAGRPIHVRLDESAARALSLLKREGLTDSEAVRRALQESAERRTRRAALAAEAAALAADPEDRAEMAEIRELMAELAPER